MPAWLCGAVPGRPGTPNCLAWPQTGSLEVMKSGSPGHREAQRRSRETCRQELFRRKTRPRSEGAQRPGRAGGEGARPRGTAGGSGRGTGPPGCGGAPPEERASTFSQSSTISSFFREKQTVVPGPTPLRPPPRGLSCGLLDEQGLSLLPSPSLRSPPCPFSVHPESLLEPTRLPSAGQTSPHAPAHSVPQGLAAAPGTLLAARPPGCAIPL